MTLSLNPNLEGLPGPSPTDRLAEALGGLLELQRSSDRVVRAAETARAAMAEGERQLESLRAALDTSALGGPGASDASPRLVQPRPVPPSPLGASGAAIAKLEARVSALHEEIGALEVANAAKGAAIEQLITQIEARKAELERARENKRRLGIFAAFLGAPLAAAVSLVQMYEDDDRLRSLNANLAKAQAERAALAAKLASHQTTRAALQRDLGRLEKAQAKLQQALTAEPPTARTPALIQVAVAAGALERARELEANLAEQIKLLERLRDSASGLGIELDQLLEALKGQLAEATQAVRQAEQGLFELIKIVTAKDPQAAAEKWLQKRVASKTEKLMEELGLSMKAFIRDLVREAFPGQERSVGAQLLTKELSKALIPAAPASALSG